VATQEMYTRIRYKAHGIYSYMLASEGSMCEGVTGRWQEINTSFESQCHCFILAFRVNKEQRVQENTCTNSLTSLKAVPEVA
jgi:hypothetical protein